MLTLAWVRVSFLLDQTIRIRKVGLLVAEL